MERSNSHFELTAITERIVDSYSRCGRLHHLGHEPLPNRESVQSILHDLCEILFPGYGRKQNLNNENIRYHVGSLLESVYDRLTLQITRALKHERCQQQPHLLDCEAEAREITAQFLAQIPSIRQILELDVEAAFRGDPAAHSHHEIIFCYPGLEAIGIFRVAHELLQLKVPFIPRMMTEVAHARTGIDIHPGAKIGPGFFIDHGTGVVIGETTEIGRNVKVYQGVTLGALSFDRDENGELVHGAYKRHPTLEDNVVVYANATILGGKTIIGQGAVIGSSVWITQSIEPNTIVVLETPQLKVKSNRRVQAS